MADGNSSLMKNETLHLRSLSPSPVLKHSLSPKSHHIEAISPCAVEEESKSNDRRSISLLSLPEEPNAPVVAAAATLDSDSDSDSVGAPCKSNGASLLHRGIMIMSGIHALESQRPQGSAIMHVHSILLTFKRYMEPLFMAEQLFSFALESRNVSGEFVGAVRFADLWLRMQSDDALICKHAKLDLLLARASNINDSSLTRELNYLKLSILRSCIRRNCEARRRNLIRNRVCVYKADRVVSQKMLQPFRFSFDASTPRATSSSLHLEDIPARARLWSFSVANIAEAITLIEHELLVAVPLSDFNDKGWSKRDAGSVGKRLRAFIKRSNVISNWVTSTILAQNDADSQSRVFTAYVLIAQHCERLGNYSTCSSILTGCGSNYVSRLFSIWWKNISAGVQAMYAGMTKTLSVDFNYRRYRAAVDKRRLEHPKVPTIPLFPAVLRDLVFIEDGNPDYMDGSINLGKVAMLHKVFGMIHAAQVASYNFKPISHDLMAHLRNLPTKNDDFFERRSAVMKPWKKKAAQRTTEPLSQPATSTSTSTSTSTATASTYTSRTSSLCDGPEDAGNNSGNFDLLDDVKYHRMIKDASEQDSPLHIAARTGDGYRACKAILDACATHDERLQLIHATNEFNETALYVAVASDDAQLAMLLLANGADPWVQSYHSETILHVASTTGDINIVRTILKHSGTTSALVQLPNSDGVDALAAAQASQHHPVVAALQHYLQNAQKK